MAVSALVRALSKSVGPLLKKGLDKRQIAEKILTAGKFTRQNIFKPGERKRYQGTFDDAFELAGGKKITPSESGQIAAAAKIKQFSDNPSLRTAENLKLSASQKEQIQKVIKTGVPSKNETVQRIANFVSAGADRSTNTYTKAQEKFASEWGGSLRKLRGQDDFAEAWHKRRTEAQALYQNLTGEITPASEIFKKYPQQWKNQNILDARQTWNNYITRGRPGYNEQLAKEFENQGIASFGNFSARYPYLAGIAHQLSINPTMKLFASDKVPNMSLKRAIQKINAPENIGIEYNFMNPAKRGLESFFSKIPEVYDVKDLGRLPKALKDAQVGLKYFDREGALQHIGMKGRELDPDKMRRYIQYIADKLPFGKTPSNRPRYLPIQKYIEELIQKNSQYSFATGGLASMIGKKALKKIAKKLSEKDLKLLMGSFFKGTKPSTSPKNLREERIKEYLAGKGATKKWQYVKSEVPGPKSSLERTKDIESTKKSFPYLDPENNAFIVAGESAHPITGTKQLDKFGRYQLRHSVDPKDTSPISKYSVYDWWDELTQSIRKEPKFKYVKDDKGNTIMKRVK